MTEAKFNFYERVKILCKNALFYYLNNTTGTVLGRVAGNHGWYYSVAIDYNKECMSFYEDELESLGTFAKREDYYSGESIRVGVTEKGEGYIIKDEKYKL